MLRRSTKAFGAVLLVISLAGCGAAGAAAPSAAPLASLPPAHPQAVEPASGAHPDVSIGERVSDFGGDPNAHARSLAEVKRELAELNLCGGATSGADAQPLVGSASFGFIADPGTVQNVGALPELTERLGALAKALGVRIYGISGYRTPAHSVAVGGYADDPHTRGEAEDIGVNSLLRTSAAQISEGMLARFGLYRPFDPSDDPSNPEVNHIQLIPAGGPVPLPDAQATFAPDPTCA